MKRAAVWKGEGTQRWWVDSGPSFTNHPRIEDRISTIAAGAESRSFPTHTEAMTHAIKRVGLDKPAEHREAP